MMDYQEAKYLVSNLLHPRCDFVGAWENLDRSTRRAAASTAVLILDGIAANDPLEREYIKAVCALYEAEMQDVFALVLFTQSRKPLIQRLQIEMRWIEEEATRSMGPGSEGAM